MSRFNDFCGDSVLRFIKQGKVLYADEQKVQDLISQQRINLADVKYLDLDRVNIILNLFVNPQAEDSAGFLWGQSPWVSRLCPICEKHFAYLLN